MIDLYLSWWHPSLLLCIFLWTLAAVLVLSIVLSIGLFLLEPGAPIVPWALPQVLFGAMMAVPELLHALTDKHKAAAILLVPALIVLLPFLVSIALGVCAMYAVSLMIDLCRSALHHKRPNGPPV